MSNTTVPLKTEFFFVLFHGPNGYHELSVILRVHRPYQVYQ